MNILYVTSEVYPFSKSGGLGDVLGALPNAVAKAKHQVRVISPLYSSVSDFWRSQMTFVKHIYVPLAWRNLYCGLFELKKDGVIHYFLDNEYYFRRGDLYGSFDDGERFAFFSRAAVCMMTELDNGSWVPDVVHCSDWQSALVPIYMRSLYGGVKPYDGIRSVFTIHNIEYQGRYDMALMGNVFGLPDTLISGGTLEYMGGISLMKGAIELSDAVTTVSPTYADELNYSFYAKGLEGVVAAQRYKFKGILNGIDAKTFDPATDPNLAKKYTFENIERKLENKRDLQRLLGLSVNDGVPIVAMVTRMVAHKGMDLVVSRLDDMMDIEMQFVLLGRGEWHYEHLFRNAQNNYPERLSANIGYDQTLSAKIYGGADIFLMPSQSEPCGLSQMIAMRYGVLPLVRETGGLKDTVIPYSPDNPASNGFAFANYNSDDMIYVLRRACELYKNKKAWRDLQRTGMATDFSWAKSAKKYIELYKSLK
ncbi:MAG: glycogen synthase GlgA [Oscillospiraceae bacterium]|nr:glycogen synthase GlgA [Oscillospiraceae bacterium]